MDTERLLTVKQFADFLGCGVTKVWTKSKSGELPAPIKICGQTRWLESEIHAWLAQKAAERTAR